MTELDELAGVHPDIAHLSWLVGSWGGFGVGQLPGGEHFRYEELVQFATDGRPFLEYRSQSWIVDDEGNRLRASHTESGYLRPAPDNGVEAVIANPMGIAELWLGTVTVSNIENARITGAKLEVHAVNFVRTPTAPAIESGNRMYGLANGDLFHAFDLELPGHSESSHAAIQLKRK
jgi:hypothetical protein